MWLRCRVSALLAGCGGGGSSVGPQFASVPAGNTVAAPITPTATSAASSADAGRAAWGCAVMPTTPNFAAETDPVAKIPNVLHHWDNLPVRVAFANDANATPERRTQTLTGFDWWAKATGQAVSYTVVSDPAQAQVLVRYEERGQTKYGAITEYGALAGNRLQSATITFNLTYLKDGRTLIPAAAHEFGHALGIAGHSTDTNDLMCATQDAYKRTAPSPRDVNTLRAAYCDTASRSVAPANQPANGTTIYCPVGAE